jgi:5-methylcytosine-specific restriction enzyme subunit McrC
MNQIPIRNVYYLLSYAWDLLEEARELAVGIEDIPRVEDLLSRLLVNGTQRLLRRGIDQGYIPQSEVLATIRGRIDFETSTRRLLLEHGKVQCNFEEFLPDLLHNRILKETLKALGSYPELGVPQRTEIHTVLRRMEGISPIRLRKAHFAQIRLHRNNAHYRLLMHLCELVHDNLLVNEETGERFFRDFLRDKRQMAKLFEKFVARFYAKELDPGAWSVRSQEQIHWDCLTPISLLPDMNADAVLRGDGRTVIVECKFYQNTLQTSLWSQHPKIRSTHLYQLMTYIRNLALAQPEQAVEGLLVYPAVEVDLLEELSLSGYRVRVCTIDLSRTWDEVADRMHHILGACT